MKKIFLSLLAFLIILGGCAPYQKIIYSPQNVVLKYSKPKIELTKATKPTQGNDKIIISVNNSGEFKPAVFREIVKWESYATYIYNKTTTPTYEIPEAQDIKFTINVENKMGHILYLDKSVVAVKINGKLVQWDDQRYTFLSKDILILPNEKMDFPIIIPSVKTSKVSPFDTGPVMTSPSEITLSIYDVVTGTDKAGNPLERMNFEWVFQYTEEEITEQRQITIEQFEMDDEQAIAAGAKKPEIKEQPVITK